MSHTGLHKNTIISCVKREYFSSRKDFEKARRLLRRYFNGEKVSFGISPRFDNLPVFTRKVLRKIRSVPYGKTVSYGRVSEDLGLKGGARAVGQALKRNPLPVIIPCHRVIKNNGEIGGFSKGIMVKKKLLEMEKQRMVCCTIRKR